ncbi:hypothetical protein [Rummeliibacillus suwonensis]|uniref:hypothetical protein n=1 Tax=Rummeliibacillus suwonensis TaxID=1306154 RepID=UPI001AAE8520|nr:hypothetical protein [Rummeliibacillus suwonensis]MBO2537014.1 hypothetical protein [Rummeliibacillus suwonensis]
MKLTEKYLNKLHTLLMKDFPLNYESEEELLIIDLVTIMGTIYCLDISKTARKKLSINIPVFQVEKWESLKKEIQDLALWVSGDKFKIGFIKNNLSFLDETSNNISFNLANNRSVTLFSGGLDSLTGAYRNFNDCIESDYIGFINKSEEKTHQEVLKDFYFSIFGSNTDIYLIEKPIKKKKHLTQATRSLLYLALAIAKAYYNHSNNVYLYENGILSLNPTIHNRFTTKTTHPRTIFEYNRILKKLKINIQINHPFLFSTKGERINEMNENFKKAIRHTFTCGSGRSNELRNHTGQCGICIPCLLRKISLSAYDNESYDSEYFIGYETKFSDIKEDEYKFQYMSNFNYFRTYYNLIVTNRIYVENHVKSKYYDDKHYGEKNKIMFEKFAKEFERFNKRYGPD